MKRPSLCRAAGFGLITAVFLIVTLAAVGVYLVTITTSQVEAVTQDEQSGRAYLAARTGIDWAAFQVLRRSPANCPATTTLPLQNGLAGFTATITCSASSESESGATVALYTIKAIGCNAAACPGTPTPTYVERELQLQVAR